MTNTDFILTGPIKGGRHSTVVSFSLRTQPTRVRIWLLEKLNQEGKKCFFREPAVLKLFGVGALTRKKKRKNGANNAGPRGQKRLFDDLYNTPATIEDNLRFGCSLAKISQSPNIKEDSQLRRTVKTDPSNIAQSQ